jgi:hypothetical protein
MAGPSHDDSQVQKFIKNLQDFQTSKFGGIKKDIIYLEWLVSKKNPI